MQKLKKKLLKEGTLYRSVLKSLLVLSSLWFITSCSHTIVDLPEKKFKTYSLFDDGHQVYSCLSQTFTISNEYIGFEKDTKEVPLKECDDTQGFKIEQWNGFEVFIKSIYDIHNIPKEKRIKVNTRPSPIRGG